VQLVQLGAPFGDLYLMEPTGPPNQVRAISAAARASQIDGIAWAR